MFDPMDERWWASGAHLNWRDSTSPVRPRWMPGRDRALEALKTRAPAVLRALGLARSYRTCETGQLHMLDPTLPARPDAGLWAAMAGAGLVDLGFPVPVDGRAWTGPRSTPFMAVRLPIHADIRPLLRPLGFTPVQTAALGTGALRGARQYDRHNLICTQLAVLGRPRGWMTCGEAWGRFDLICRDPLMGRGGPDLQLVGSDMRVCVEMTASGHMELDGKMRRWDRALEHDSCMDTHVVWLDAARDSPLLGQLERLCADRPRMHAATARDWLDGDWTCADGFGPAPGDPVEPDDWMRPVMADIGARVGLPAAGSWRLPERLRGVWLG